MSLKKQFLKSKPICKVTFRLPKEAAENTKEVKLLGDFNDWDATNVVPMKFNKTGFWTTLDLKEGVEYQFRYLLDDKIWMNDWQADKYVATPFGVEDSVVSTFTR